jgi:hypothetical protein
MSNKINLLFSKSDYVFYVIILRRITLLTRTVISTGMSVTAVDLGNNKLIFINLSTLFYSKAHPTAISKLKKIRSILRLRKY